MMTGIMHYAQDVIPCSSTNLIFTSCRRSRRTLPSQLRYNPHRNTEKFNLIINFILCTECALSFLLLRHQIYMHLALEYPRRAQQQRQKEGYQIFWSDVGRGQSWFAVGSRKTCPFSQARDSQAWPRDIKQALYVSNSE